MKKQILTIFIIICITSIFNTSMIFAEEQPNDKSSPIKNSKYLVLVQSQVRNSEGVLISTGETERVFILLESITDEYLDSFPVFEKVVINGKTYEKFLILFIDEPIEDTFTGRAVLISETDESVVLFSALTHGYTVEKGDKVEHIWTILRLIS